MSWSTTRLLQSRPVIYNTHTPDMWGKHKILGGSDLGWHARLSCFAGVSGGLYLLTRDRLGSSETQETDPDPVAQRQEYDLPNPEVRRVQHMNGPQLYNQQLFPMMPAILRQPSWHSKKVAAVISEMPCCSCSWPSQLHDTRGPPKFNWMQASSLDGSRQRVGQESHWSLVPYFTVL